MKILTAPLLLSLTEDSPGPAIHQAGDELEIQIYENISFKQNSQNIICSCPAVFERYPWGWLFTLKMQSRCCS